MTAIILGIISIVLFVVVINFFSMTLNDFLEKTIKKFIWLWLPFHAFKRLTKEFRERYIKQ